MHLDHEMPVGTLPHTKQAYALPAPNLNPFALESIPKAIARWVGSQDVTALWIQRTNGSILRFEIYFTKVVIGSIPETNNYLRQSRRPSYVNLPPGGFISPSV